MNINGIPAVQCKNFVWRKTEFPLVRVGSGAKVYERFILEGHKKVQFVLQIHKLDDLSVKKLTARFQGTYEVLAEWHRNSKDILEMTGSKILNTNK